MITEAGFPKERAASSESFRLGGARLGAAPPLRAASKDVRAHRAGRGVHSLAGPGSLIPPANVAVVEGAFGRRPHQAVVNRIWNAGMLINGVAGVEEHRQRMTVETHGSNRTRVDENHAHTRASNHKPETPVRLPNVVAFAG
jgi:hypothetical protein